MGINRVTVLELINDVHNSRGFKDYNSYTYLFDQVDTMPEEPHWVSVTEALPDMGRIVVVCGEKGTWDYGMYRGFLSTNVHLWNWKGKTLKKVYWWMYKEDALAMPYEE